MKKSSGVLEEFSVPSSRGGPKEAQNFGKNSMFFELFSSFGGVLTKMSSKFENSQNSN